MTGSKHHRIAWACCCLLVISACDTGNRGKGAHFDALKRTLQINNWQFVLQVANRSAAAGTNRLGQKTHYLKATLDLSNIKTGKSLLYSIADDNEDYEAKYKYLSFGSKNDLYIQYGEAITYPIGYVFEPSNGLSGSERLVYTFQIDDTTYSKLKQDESKVEYWYIDRMAGLGKICFTHNN